MCVKIVIVFTKSRLLYFIKVREREDEGEKG